LTPKHAYALLRYDSKTDTVDLWNPHGNNFKPKGPPGLTNGYPTKDGLFTVPLDDFVQQFTGVSFEGKFADISLESAEPADDDSTATTLEAGDPVPLWKPGKWIQGKPVKKLNPGTAYLVEFWASWCEPCRISIPYLDEIHKRYRNKGLVVIGQDCREQDDGQIAPFMKLMKNKMTYPLALEAKPGLGKGRMAQEWLMASGRDSLPTAFLVDTNGRIAWIGHPLALKEQLIEDVLAGTFDAQKVAAQRAREREARELFKQASDLVKNDKLAEAEEPLNHLLSETNDDADQMVQFLTMRANVLARTAHWEQAAADLKQVLKIDPSDFWNWSMLTPLLIQSGNTADYRSHCKAMLDRFNATTVPRIAESTAKTCLLLPSAGGPDDLNLAGVVAGNAVTYSEKGDRMFWRLMTSGLAEYRQGRFTNAIEKMQLAQKAMARMPAHWWAACKADAWFVMAMAHHHLLQSDAARTDLANGLEVVQKRLPKLDGGDLGQEWFDVLPAYILMREAKETIEGTPATEEKPRGGAKL
jgi:thiol-disulfide isomerase/thioredoxin/tetratricopeptide (TPR) repeat protein